VVKSHTYRVVRIAQLHPSPHQLSNLRRQHEAGAARLALRGVRSTPGTRILSLSVGACLGLHDRLGNIPHALGSRGQARRDEVNDARATRERTRRTAAPKKRGSHIRLGRERGRAVVVPLLSVAWGSYPLTETPRNRPDASPTNR
jgi:hypothetical protein